MEWSEVNEGFACESKAATNFNDVVDARSRHFGATWAYATIVPHPLACFFLREKLNFGAKKMLMWRPCISSLWESKSCLQFIGVLFKWELSYDELFLKRSTGKILGFAEV